MYIHVVPVTVASSLHSWRICHANPFIRQIIAELSIHAAVAAVITLLISILIRMSLSMNRNAVLMSIRWLPPWRTGLMIRRDSCSPISSLIAWSYLIRLMRWALFIITVVRQTFCHVPVMIHEGYVCSAMSGESDLRLPVAAGNDSGLAHML